MLYFSVHWMLKYSLRWRPRPRGQIVSANAEAVLDISPLICFSKSQIAKGQYKDYLVGQLTIFGFRSWRVFRFVKMMISWIVDKLCCIFKRTLAPCFFPTGEFLGKFSEHLLDEYLRLRLFFYGDNDDDATVQWWTPSSDDVLASSLIVPQPDFFAKTGRTYSLSMFLDSLSMFSDSLSMFSVNMRGNPQLFRGCL